MKVNGVCSLNHNQKKEQQGRKSIVYFGAATSDVRKLAEPSKIKIRLQNFYNKATNFFKKSTSKRNLIENANFIQEPRRNFVTGQPMSQEEIDFFKEILKAQGLVKG